MLEVLFFLYIIWTFLQNKTIRKTREKLFILCVITTIFFFSSDDFFIGLPLYIYPMMLNLILSLIDSHRINKKIFFTAILLLICILIPLAQIGLGMQSGKFLLLKQSNTDVFNVEQELVTPKVNFIVIKHLLFFVAYILFIILNTDILKSHDFVETLVSRVEIMFHVLIGGLIIEWSIVNVLGGWNDRELMDVVFSLHGVNQKENWYSWGSYNVALWFSERSNYFNIALYYLIMLKKQKLHSRDWLWIVLSAVACYCTGSSSALMILIVYICAQTVVMVKNGNAGALIVMMIVAACGGYILVKYYSVYAPKIMDFLSGTGGYGSGYWRGRSIIYGIKALISAPFFGIGIGTVYAHGMLIQTLANIGVIGFCVTLWLHHKVCPIRLNFKNVVCAVYFLGISYGSFMVQHFTSPIVVCVFIILHWGEKVNAEKNS